MRFFDNSAINRTYLHSILQMLAEYTGGVFIYVYLLRAGVALPLVIGAIGTWALGRLVLRQIVLPAAIRFGLRNCLVFGASIDAICYLILGQVHGLGPLLLIYILTSSFGNCFYWTCYHTTVAMMGNAEKRGSQVSAIAAIAALNSIAGPLMGGFILVHAGTVYGFLAAAFLQAISIIPLLTMENLTIAKKATIDGRTLKHMRRIYFADGFGNSCGFFIWALALFQTLGESFSSFGAALAVAGAVGAVMSLGAGRLIDLGHSKYAQQIAYGVMALSLVLKSVGYGHVWSAIAANALGAVAGPLYWSAMMSRVYNLAQSSPCPLRFQMAGEGAWDLGTATGCFVAAILIWLGFGFSLPLVLGVAAAGFGYIALTKTEVA